MLAAKAVTTGRAIAVLVAEGCLTETKLLQRSLLDALIDLLYIHSDPKRTQEFRRLVGIEIAVDRYERLKFMATTSGTTVLNFVKRNPNLRTIVAQFDKAKKHPAFANGTSRKKRGKTKRWKDVQTQEKLKAIKVFDHALKPFGFTIRSLANAHAHHRPAGLREFFYLRKDGSAGVRTRPPARDFLYSADWVAFETSLCLLVLCDQMTSMFFLGQALEKKTRRILDRLRALQRQKRASKMIPSKPMML